MAIRDNDPARWVQTRKELAMSAIEAQSPRHPIGCPAQPMRSLIRLRRLCAIIALPANQERRAC
jgi:hypothetical protein